MSRDNKLILRIEAHRKGTVPFTDRCRYLGLYGWRMDRQSGSHKIFRDSTDRIEMSIPTVRGREVKAFYVRKAVEIVKREEGSGPVAV